MKYTGYYAYKELRAAAVSADATQEDIEDLVRWLRTYDSDSWNGESYDIDDGLRLFPVYDFDSHTQEEIDDGIDPCGWEIR